MKRSFPSEIESNFALANCLMLLSQGGNTYDQHAIFNNQHHPSRVFECKTCNRQFGSFQALGGHRASHKKLKLLDGDDGSAEKRPPAKPKTHECSICGVEFTIGQALGGHMRRHRIGSSGNQDQHDEALMTPIVKKSSSRRVLCLDLNLTPLENDMELFKLGKAAPAIDCFF
ncbi:putative nuclease HARBI1 [Hibiscus syriacus]|uniref:Nuclease HARBI1 n=1 Tax=Hibiscus syriacus TaxID=106335 RepID=A0A6A2XQS1_HIBSY|nr:zinc finger protein ZAT12-like [Hibiscus syriacus]KAE8669245.1 putative nuclease HARBI1 [Hibiscus syriacus]